MSKSIQDLIMWQRKLAQELGATLICVEIFDNKSFRICEHKDEEAVSLYDSDNVLEQIDINDLPYYDPKDFANKIKIQQDAANIDASEL